MLTWEDITLISMFPVLFIVLLLILIRKKCSKPTAPSDMMITDVDESPSFIQEMITHQNLDEQGLNRSSRNVYPQRKAIFSWADHPSLLAQAVENGWSPFSFAPSPSIKPAASSHGNESNVVISWEVFDESAEYMQKMILNPGVEKSITSCLSVIRTALPLPGPRFANAAFPQEAYFEVTILPNQERAETNQLDRDEGETRKPIRGEINGNNKFEFSNHIHSKRNKIEEVKIGGNGNGIVLIGIGLTAGNHLPLKFPGSFPGSVGFNSTGSLHLDGMKLVQESENKGWGRVGDVIGCGYNPAYKKVFFTLNSKLVNEIRCKTEEFGHPLYPTLAANTEATVMVNLGQSPFKFGAANFHRTSNPCFITTLPGSSPSALYELDSMELFSMGRIDGKWKQWATTIAINSDAINVDSDRLSEPDLFEIAVK